MFQPPRFQMNAYHCLPTRSQYDQSWGERVTQETEQRDIFDDLSRPHHSDKTVTGIIVPRPIIPKAAIQPEQGDRARDPYALTPARDPYSSSSRPPKAEVFQRALESSRRMHTLDKLQHALTTERQERRRLEDRLAQLAHS